MSLFSLFKKAPLPAVVEKQPEKPATRPAPDLAVLAAQEEQALKAAIAAGDARTVVAAVNGGSSTRIRQLAAEAIDAPDLIRQLVKQARGGKDKNVYKILVRKRDALLARERLIEEQRAQIVALAADLDRHSRRAYDPLFVPTLEQLEHRWHAVAVHADQDIVMTAQRSIERAREVISLHLQHIAAQASRELAAANEAEAQRARREQDQQAAAAAAAERARTLEEERKVAQEKREAEQRALSQIGGLLRKALGALSAGSSRTAAGIRRTLDEKLIDAPPLPANLAAQLKQLDVKLQELKDWKSFSVVPKRAELIEQMEALVGATLHPPELAGHIKDLQDQWRTLSKGAGEDAEADWQRFHEAAQKAFEPCREYFAEQDQVRQENLRQRGLLYERLRAFEQNQNWEQPDWRMAITAVREARQLWRQHSPVDVAEGQALQQSFNELTASLQARIDAQYERNVKAKRLLIERARGLAASADGRAAIDEVKLLQEKWKSIGPVPRDDDRKLWEDFREQCDAVFAKRQQEFASHSAALEANRVLASSLCDEMDAIAGLSDQELLDKSKQLPDLRLTFDAIEDLPKANARQLRDRFERAFERCKRAISQQQARDAEQGWDHVLEAANIVRAYRLARLQEADVVQLDALKQTAEERIANSRAPKPGVDAIKHALASTDDGTPAGNELALRTLCIRAEILTDTPTPIEDHALRREYQLRRLMEAMGQGGSAGREQIDTLTLQWIGVGPVEVAIYEPLVERFKECRRQSSSVQRSNS
jgi:hypothetical protein